MLLQPEVGSDGTNADVESYFVTNLLVSAITRET